MRNVLDMFKLTFATYGRAFWRLIVVSLLTMILTHVWIFYCAHLVVAEAGKPGAAGDWFPLNLPAFWFGPPWVIAVSFWDWGATIHLARETVQGRYLSISEALKKGLFEIWDLTKSGFHFFVRVVVPLIAIAVAAYFLDRFLTAHNAMTWRVIAFTLEGFAALYFVFLGIRFFLIVPVTLFEREIGVAALRRSDRIMKGVAREEFVQNIVKLVVLLAMVTLILWPFRKAADFLKDWSMNEWMKIMMNLSRNISVSPDLILEMPWFVAVSIRDFLIALLSPLFRVLVTVFYLELSASSANTGEGPEAAVEKTGTQIT